MVKNVNDQFPPIIGNKVKEKHIEIALSTILLPSEMLHVFVRMGARSIFSHRYLIITNKRLIEWFEGNQDFEYYTFDIITNVHHKKSWLSNGWGDVEITTLDGRSLKFPVRETEYYYVAERLHNLLQNYQYSIQSSVVERSDQPIKDIKSTIFCRYCGSENPSEYKFCTKCGEKI